MAAQGFFRQIGAVCLVFCLAACAQFPVQTTIITTPPPLVLTAQTIMGAPAAELNAQFGQPALLRRDGPAQVWLYHSDVCGLNLILYPDSAGIPRVAAAVPDGGDPARCMTSLQHNVTETALEPPTSS